MCSITSIAIKHPTQNSITKKQLRTVLRARRKKLSALQQKLASHTVYQNAKQIIKSPLNRHIGFYFANDGEIDTTKLISLAIRYNKDCYLPYINKKRTLEFRSLPKARWRMQLTKGRYGILTPKAGQPQVQASELDCVFVPLVGFDGKRKRLGMGGGYYDRTFAALNKRAIKKTRLIGLAHRCQKIREVPSDHWDITLDKVFIG